MVFDIYLFRLGFVLWKSSPIDHRTCSVILSKITAETPNLVSVVYQVPPGVGEAYGPSPVLSSKN